MRRLIMLSVVVTIVLAAYCAFGVQQDFPSLLGDATIGVNVPSNWNAVMNVTSNTANDTEVPCIYLTDKSDVNRWFMIFLADKLDAEGHSLTLRQVGNNMLSAYSNRSSRRIDDGNTSGYYCFEYLITNGVAHRFVFMDTDYDKRIKAGRYLTYQYSYDSLEPEEVDAITSSITINGESRQTSNTTDQQTDTPTGQQTGGQSGETGGRTDTIGVNTSGDTTGQQSGNTSDDSSPSGGGSSGGCTTGTGAISLLALGLALITRRSM